MCVTNHENLMEILWKIMVESGTHVGGYSKQCLNIMKYNPRTMPWEALALYLGPVEARIKCA